MTVLFFFFFFSSRRRHTRLQGDWSSDVCSSDRGGGAMSELHGVVIVTINQPNLFPFRGGSDHDVFTRRQSAAPQAQSRLRSFRTLTVGPQHPWVRRWWQPVQPFTKLFEQRLQFLFNF